MRGIFGRSWLTSLLVVGCLAGVPVLGQETQKGQASPSSPAFHAWQQRQQEQRAQEALGLAVPRDDHLFGYIPELEDYAAGDGRGPQSQAMASAALPATYDLRTLNYLTVVRNQSPFGCCWAFSAMASLESNLLRNAQGTFNLSEWHLAWFAYNDFSSILPGFDKGTAAYGDDPVFDLGGNNSRSTAMLSRGTGPATEASCPYQTVKSYSAASLPTGAEATVISLMDAHGLPSGFTSDTIKTQVMTYGAVATPIYWEDASYSSTTRAYRRTTTGDTNHLVNIVGWNDSFPKENFPAGNQPAGNGAWIVMGCSVTGCTNVI